MNTDTWIRLNGKQLYLNEIDLFSSGTEFEKTTLDFIRSWQNGASSFRQLTSGSTGSPKIIHISRKAMTLSAKKTIKALQLKPKQTCLLCLHSNYIAGKMMIVRALEGQMNIIAEEPSSTPQAILNGEQIDFTALIPYQVDQLINKNKGLTGLNAIKTVIIGGAPMSQSLILKIKKLQCTAYATFGMTETVSHIALKPLNKNPSPYFHILDNVEIDVDRRQCLTLTSDVTDFNQIVTNDRVNIIDKRTFEWLGRIDNIINSGGVKIQSEGVERVFEEVFHKLGIRQRFFVIGENNSALGELVTLVIEGDILQNQSHVVDLASKKLSKYELPKQIYYCPTFVETETGKIKRLQSFEQAL